VGRKLLLTYNLTGTPLRGISKMKCPKCQFDNPRDAKFCTNCGNKLQIVCPQCAKTNPPGSKFCSECGHNLTLPAEPSPKELSFAEKLDKIQRYLPGGLTEKILAQRGKIEGERRQVTVLFSDMKGFTPLTEQLGPEEAYSIMDQVYEILIHKVHDYGGTVNEMTGDGIMALFGAPIALEDAPQRAIRSALATHREIAKFNERATQEHKGIPALKMRIGINTGPVVVGTLGNNLRVEFKAVGDTVNLASRMEGLAEPGTTYITEETFKLTEGLFRFEALGEKEIKGKEESVKAYRVIAPSSRRTRFDVSAERGLTPFVGRERELELLLDGFERSKAGRGQAFSIVSEAGVGKSRLLYEFRKAVAHEDVIFLEGRCLSYSRGVAYHPVIDILKASFDIAEGDGDLEIREKVQKGLKVLGADEATTLPYLLELLSVKDSGIDKIPLSPEAKKDRIMEAVKRITLKGSETRPLITAYEDLHWIDRSSEDHLKHLLESVPGARILLIFTYRPEFVHTWGGKSYHSQVNLNRLSNRESLAMLSYLLGADEIDKDLEELILEKTEGVPFFIEELIKSLKDLKIIERKDNKYHLTKDIKGLLIPSTIQDVIMARVDSLPEETKSLLQTGSVVGREFSYDLIKRVTDITQEELLSHLSVLKDSELVYERGIYPQSTYIFKHALIQDATYQSLLKSSRQKHHQKIAQVLEKHFPDTMETEPELLAHHYTEAGLSEQAVGYWHQAGKRATQRSAHMEAINHLTKGLEVLTALPATLERARQELDLQTTLGPVLGAVKGFASPDTARAYARARELCQQVGETPQFFPVLYGLWRFYMVRAELQTTRDLAEQLFSIAQRAQDPALLLEAHRLLGPTMFWLGELGPAREHLEQGMALYDPQQHCSHVFVYGQDPGVACQSFAAWAMCALGYLDQALQSINKALTLAQELTHPFSVAYALQLAVFVHQFRRETQEVQKRAEAVIALSAEQGFPYWLAFGTILRGWAITAQGEGAEGIAQVRQGLVAHRATGAELHVPYFLCLLAEAYGKVGQPEEGLTALVEALAIVDNTGERHWEAELHRHKGELLLMQQRQKVAEAEDCFRQALETARRQQAKSFELRATMSLSRLWQHQGKQKEAHQLLAETYGWFTEGFDTADLKEAKALIEELID
jgi:predicted ATPase/class 3 adenylate cyclase